MSRASSGRKRATLSPSLFPFLAVLVCTLGTLILLLALVAQDAKDAAEHNARAAAQAADTSIAAKPAPTPIGPRVLSADAAAKMLDEQSFRLRELISHRDSQTADLEKRRDQWTQVEDHTRRLKDELIRLNREVEQAMSGKPTGDVDQQTLVMMRDEIAALEGDIAALKEKRVGGKPRVVLVPHKGPNGTDRRAVYVECTAEGVTVQPEGSLITLTQLIAASENPSPSANPLDAALRTVRRHAMQNYGDQTPPYPLLVVRPDGIETYKYARDAMKDWEDHYGYELVPGEVDLAFPQPDKNLKRTMELAIHEANARSIGMANFARRGGGQRGGGSTDDRFADFAAGDRIDGPADFSAMDSAPGGGPPTGSGRSGQGDFAGGEGGEGSFASPGEVGRSADMAANGRREPSQPKPTLSARDLDLQARAGGFRPAADDLQGIAASYGAATPGSQSRRYGAATSVTGGTQSPSASLNDLLDNPSGKPESTSGRSGQTNPPGQGGGGVDAAGQTLNQPPSSASGTAATSSASGMTAATQDPTAMDPNALRDPPLENLSSSPPGATAGSAGADPGSPPITSRQGSNWAMPRDMAGQRGAEVIRPITMVCHPDKYTLIDRGQVVAEFPFDSSGSYNATLQLATAVRDRVSQWGATMPGARWQPRLDVLVEPHADRRFHELRTLMNGSGIDVQRRVK